MKKLENEVFFRMKKNLHGKHFSITDTKNVNTVIYQINKTEKKYAKDAPKYTIERLEYIEELVGERKKKTFFVENPSPSGNYLAMFSFGQDRVVINMGILEEDRIRVAKKAESMSFKTIYSEKEMEYKDFSYTPNLKRPISIIDPVTAEEVKPTLYFDEETNQIKGKCKLRPYKSYFAFEIREKKK